MIGLHQSDARHHQRGGEHEIWRSFSEPNGAAAYGEGFGQLLGLAEHRFAPGASARGGLGPEAEIFTYVRTGALAYGDSAGSSGVIQAGEFQRHTAKGGRRYTATNASSTHAAQSFQIRLRLPDAGMAASAEQRRFSAAERRGGLRLVASPDGRRDSLRLHLDVLIYSALLESGKHLVHELALASDGGRRSAWLHVVEGQIAIADLLLTGGDGAAVTADSALSFTAQQETEILLIDLA
jgi:redox-sensitive bicupin YhaK (pirin superfamily)